MEADRKLVRKIAALAMLGLSGEEEAEFARDLNIIMGYMNRLAETNTDGFEPMEHVVPLINVLRQDIPEGFGDRNGLIGCAADVRDDCYVVPSVVDDL